MSIRRPDTLAFSDRTALKILFFVTEDWYFCSHRLRTAAAVRNAGYDVSVITRVRNHGEQIKASGIELFPIELSRRSKNPLLEISAFIRLLRTYRKIRPDIVHHVALKPVVYGSLAARLAGVPHTVNALAGLGYIYSSNSAKARFLRCLYERLMRFCLKRGNSVLLLQNPDDVHFVQQRRLVERCNSRIIKGSGVSLEEFSYKPEPSGIPLITLPARMLWDKGVREFVQAAQILGQQGVKARFALVGDVDTENPAAISRKTLREWQNGGVVEVWGHCANMPDVFQQSHVVCLPSYREGLPKALLEAAASGRSIVTTDVPGCREVVQHGRNGLLVPARDASAVAAALLRLINDPAERNRFGLEGRRIVEQEFSSTKVIAEHLRLYSEMVC